MKNMFFSSLKTKEENIFSFIHWTDFRIICNRTSHDGPFTLSQRPTDTQSRCESPFQKPSWLVWGKLARDKKFRNVKLRFYSFNPNLSLNMIIQDPSCLLWNSISLKIPCFFSFFPSPLRPLGLRFHPRRNLNLWSILTNHFLSLSFLWSVLTFIYMFKN